MISGRQFTIHFGIKVFQINNHVLIPVVILATLLFKNSQVLLRLLLSTQRIFNKQNLAVLTFNFPSDRPWIQNVMGTASKKGTDLFWPTDRAPRKSIQIGSNLMNHTSRGSTHNAVRENVGVDASGLVRFDVTSAAETCDRIRSVTTHKSSIFDGNPDAKTKLPSCKECSALARSARDEPVSRMFVNTNRDTWICIVFGRSLWDGASAAASIITCLTYQQMKIQ